MTAVQFEAVIFEIMSAKVMVEPEEARAMILEARELCRYLERARSRQRSGVSRRRRSEGARRPAPAARAPEGRPTQEPLTSLPR